MHHAENEGKETLESWRRDLAQASGTREILAYCSGCDAIVGMAPKMEW